MGWRLFVCCVVVSLLSGCGSINTYLAETMADKIPTWAGGVPKDSPPRSTDPRYAAFLEEQKAHALKPEAADLSQPIH